MSGCVLQPDAENGFTQVVGVGGIGAGIIFALEGDQTLGRNESRLGRRLNARDYCKLHIVEHYIAALMGAGRSGSSFRVLAVGNIGWDRQGEELMRQMVDAGMDIGHIRRQRDQATLFSVSLLYPDQSACNITSSNSAASCLDAAQLDGCRRDLVRAGRFGVALCLPEVPLALRHEFLEMATAAGSYRVASFASGEMDEVRERRLLGSVDLLALNQEEAGRLARLPSAEIESTLLEACSGIALEANPEMRLILSVGRSGAYAFDQGKWTHHPSLPVEVVSATGAGDALLAGVIAGLAAGLPFAVSADEHSEHNGSIDTAMEIGILLACFSITSPHTIHPGASLDALLAFRRRTGAEAPQQGSLPSAADPDSEMEQH